MGNTCCVSDKVRPVDPKKKRNGTPPSGSLSPRTATNNNDNYPSAGPNRGAQRRSSSTALNLTGSVNSLNRPQSVSQTQVMRDEATAAAAASGSHSVPSSPAPRSSQQPPLVVKNVVTTHDATSYPKSRPPVESLPNQVSDDASPPAAEDRHSTVHHPHSKAGSAADLPFGAVQKQLQYNNNTNLHVGIPSAPVVERNDHSSSSSSSGEYEMPEEQGGSGGQLAFHLGDGGVSHTAAPPPPRPAVIRDEFHRPPPTAQGAAAVSHTTAARSQAPPPPQPPSVAPRRSSFDEDDRPPYRPTAAGVGYNSAGTTPNAAGRVAVAPSVSPRTVPPAGACPRLPSHPFPPPATTAATSSRNHPPQPSASDSDSTSDDDDEEEEHSAVSGRQKLMLAKIKTKQQQQQGSTTPRTAVPTVRPTSAKPVITHSTSSHLQSRPTSDTPATWQQQQPRPAKFGVIRRAPEPAEEEDDDDDEDYDDVDEPQEDQPASSAALRMGQ